MLTEMPLAGVRDRVLMLRSLPSFSGLDDDGLTLVAEHARGRTFRAGEALLREGEALRNVYIVLEGKVASNRNGKLVAIVTRSRGVGFLSLLARDEQGVTAIAEEDTQTLEIPAEAVNGALEENFSLLRNTLRLSASVLVRKRGNLPASPDKPPALVLGEYRERPRTLVERILELRERGGIFRHCNLDALVEVARRNVEVRVEAGQEFWKIGESSTFWLRIDHGRVRCTSADGKSVDVGHTFVLGIMDALGQEPRSYQARAETRVIAYRADLDAFLAVLEAHFELGRDLIAVVSRAVLETPETDAGGQ